MHRYEVIGFNLHQNKNLPTESLVLCLRSQNSKYFNAQQYSVHICSAFNNLNLSGSVTFYIGRARICSFRGILTILISSQAIDADKKFINASSSLVITLMNL